MGRKNDEILQTLHLGGGVTLGPGDEDKLKKALANAGVEDVDAELDRLAAEGAIRGFGTSAPDADEKASGKGSGGRTAKKASTGSQSAGKGKQKPATKKGGAKNAGTEPGSQ